MKTLGRSNAGGWIIELTDDEAQLLALAEKAVDGCPMMSTFGMARGGPTDNMPFSKLCRALRGWLSAKFAVNDLKAAVERCEQALGE